ADIKSPVGGVIGINNGKLTGYMEETAYISCIKRVPIADFASMLAAYGKAQDKYLSYGIATVQEGMMVAQMLPLYTALINSGILKIDVVGYPDTASIAQLKSAMPLSVGAYDKHFKIGGVKIFLDGSPQVKTAWMQAPYQNSGDYCGYGTMTDDEVLNAVSNAANDGVQILAHCNGDAAIQQYINAVSSVSADNKNLALLKPVIIHSQLITKAQLAKAAQLNMIPSFFIAHILHWGDIHISNFGYERASSISPAHTALNLDIPFTFHQDAPVIEPNMLETVQCAVIRQTKSGITLGESECIDVLDALKAITVNAAYQYSEQDVKGSIKIGKQADFVILSDNPLQAEHNAISDIKILATIKSGECVYRK
ncbi:MAG: amidohydrolase family protein, partial [Oscillospiraceae bacterium]